MSQTQEECLALLERIRWCGVPQCPYCHSTKAALMRREQRYHCNSCFTSYSVTVGTLFHRTHVELPKWFRAIQLVIVKSEDMSVRQLAAAVEVNKNTAAYMLARISRAATEEAEFLDKLSKAIEKS